MPVDAHRAGSPTAIRCFVLTVSDTRRLDTETSGRTAAELLTAGGHVVTARALVRDEPAEVVTAVREHVNRDDVDAVITTGGTGLSPRDTTREALEPLFERTIDGFGELFRMLSFEEIGSAAMLSRATAGVIGGCPVFLLPGSEAAVRLAVTRLIAPELGHILGQMRRRT